MAEQVEDVEFLKDQVQRLSAILSKYQEKYPTVTANESSQHGVLQVDGPRPAWLYNKRLLVPLLTEYDIVIAEQKKEIAFHKSAMDELAEKVKLLCEDNSKLQKDYRKSLESRLSSSGQGSTRRCFDLDVVDHLQQQLDVVREEKTSYKKMAQTNEEELKQLRKSYQEISALTRHLKEELSSSKRKEKEAISVSRELKRMCQVLEQERLELLSKAGNQEKDLQLLQEKMSTCQRGLDVELLKNSELKKALDEIAARLKKRESDYAVWEDRGREVEERVHHLEIANRSLESKLAIADKNMALYKEDKVELEEKMATLNSELSVCKDKEMEMLSHVKESMQMVESSLMEKEQSELREQQKTQEIARLKKVMAEIIGEAGEKAAEEVDLIRTELNDNISRMASEIKSLELECSEKQVQLEKMTREKRTLEAELSKVHGSSPTESERYISSLHQLQGKLRAVERAKNEALAKEGRIARMVQELEQRIEEQKKVIINSEERNRILSQQFEVETDKLRKEKLDFLQELQVARDALRSNEQASASLEERIEKEVSAITRSREMQEVEATQRLASMEKSHRSKVQQLQQELLSVQRKNLRYRSEAKSLAHKFEMTIMELRNSCENQRCRNSELAAALNRTREEKQLLEEEVSQLSRDRAACKGQLEEEEYRADQALKQVAALLERERELCQERRTLKQQISRIKLELSRNFKS